MIETDEQRRWWFATHPEYSWGRKGRRKSGNSAAQRRRKKVTPEAVDAYVDDALKYAQGPLADLLKSVKRNFGTGSDDNPKQPGLSNDPSNKPYDNDSHEPRPYRRLSGEDLRRMGIPTPEQEALEQDPHTFLDVFPYRRFITAPVRSFKELLWSSATDSIVHAANKVRKRSQSRVLGRNLEKAGKPNPSSGHDAHHLVLSGHSRAEASRKILAKYRIDINGSENGMWIDRNFHYTLSNNHKYMDGVHSRLKRAKNRKEAVAALEEVRNFLSKGEIPQ